ncbi:MAG: phosphoribosylanthranilate isomerase [Phycisphaerae bacterium]|nr:phosphoribosylanthranilate isomerase [Phycisphaerae bacterium]
MQRPVKSPKVKICGITRPADAVAAATAGVDAIGLNFYSGPRRINLTQARAILDALSGQVPAVALIDGSATGEYSAAHLVAALGVRLFQVYAAGGGLAGPIPPAPAAYGLVAHVAQPADLTQLPQRIGTAAFPVAAVLLDACVPGRLGGTGTSFNWQWVATARAAGALTGLPPLILAGGLNPGNVAAAITIAQPDWVDVSGGVESGSPGIKDARRIADFMAAVRSA